MENITYLLGAGASCGTRTENKDKTVRNIALPLVFEIPDRIKGLINLLKNVNPHFFNPEQENFLEYIEQADIIKLYNKSYGVKLNKNKIDPSILLEFKFNLNNLISEFSDLSEDVENHASIDTYAKKLYFISENSPHKKQQYERIKQLLDLFFCFEQFIFEFDLRYDLFLASIIKQDGEKKPYIPPKLNIVSWNYDFQFEISLSKFFQSTTLFDIRQKFNNLLINTKIDEEFNQNFNFFKLNGGAGGFIKDGQYYSDKTSLISFLNLKLDESEINKGDLDDAKELAKYRKKTISLQQFAGYMIIKDFLYNTGEIFAPIKFAWEHNMPNLGNMQKGNVLHINKILYDTKILVIIGYSFPTFNREIDKSLLGILSTEIPIYLQVPNIKTFDEIQTKIKLLSENRQNNIQYIESGNEFFVPFEFN